MQVREPIGISPGTSVGDAREDSRILADSAGVAVGVRHAFSARVRGFGNAGPGATAAKWVEVPILGREGEVSGILCRAAPRSRASGAIVVRGREEAKTMASDELAQFMVHDINNLLAVIGNGLQLLERQSDAASRKAIIGKMEPAIARIAALGRRLLDAARPCSSSAGSFVAAGHLAALAETLDEALRPEIAVRTDIAPDLWDIGADPEELYFALLNLCRNASDAIPDSGEIAITARNIEPSVDGAQRFIEIVVADDGEGMSEDVLAQALTPFFTTKTAGSGTGLGLAHVRRFVEGRGGVVKIDSKPGAGTHVRLFIPRAGDASPSSGSRGARAAETQSAARACVPTS